MGPIETAAVKQAIGFHSARMMPPGQAQALIRDGVKRGVARRRDLKPFRVARPVKTEVRFNEIVKAEIASYIPGVDRITGNTIGFTTPDMTTAAQFLAAIESLRP